MSSTTDQLDQPLGDPALLDAAPSEVYDGEPPPVWRDPAVVGEPGWVAALWAWQEVEARIGPLPEPAGEPGGVPGPCQPRIEAEETGGEGWGVSPWSELAVPDDCGAPSEVLDTSVVTVPEWDRDRLGPAAEPVELLGRLAGERALPLDATAPGSGLAVLIEMADPATVADATLLELIAATERVKSWAEAVAVSATQALVDRCGGLRGVGAGPEQVDPSVMAGAELGPVLGISPAAAGGRVGFAQALRRLPATHAALHAGRLDWAQARTLVAATAVLDDAAAAAVEARVLGRAGRLAKAGFAAAVRRAVIGIDPGAAERRRRDALAERGVWRELVEDGLAELTWRAGAVEVERLYRRIDALARQAQAGDRDRARAARAAGAEPARVRTLDQARADVLADLGRDGLAALLDHAGDEENPRGDGPRDEETVPDDDGPGQEEPADDPARGDGPRGDGPCDQAGRDGQAATAGARDGGQEPGGGGVQVQVVVSLATLLGLARDPGELVGLGPITAEAARELAAEGTWQRLVTDPVTGWLVAMESTAYRPPPRMAEAVDTRDRRCRWPGCRAPATACDHDHTKPWPVGPTCPANLACLCRRHHRIKTLTDTTAVADGHGGLTWTLPSGKRWQVPPDDPLAPDGVYHEVEPDEPPF